MVNRFAIKIAYLGQNYYGFQRQREGIPTIEGTIINKLQEIGIIDTVEKARYSAAGRTDRGVNAIGQVIALDSLREKIYLEELNQYFPKEIYAWAIARVAPDFNARRDARSRRYHYFYPYQGENLETITTALQKIEGTHDFVKLCKGPEKQGENQWTPTTIRTIDQAKVSLTKNKKIIKFEFVSRSFLWKQVRKMVTLLTDVGKGLFTPEIMDHALNPQSKRPKGGIKPAPPEGLVLSHVAYPKIIFSKIRKKFMIENRLMDELNSRRSMISVLELMKEEILD
ncbi:MAG: tRNA pseudouridine(38-40) synthase TruA [Candidatus Heimdallarchaeota archaeon]|nr:tRNA pseudouridine(38-40) synthase TruA [Candidatus Heimdallarchaeota archaeon]